MSSCAETLTEVRFDPSGSEPPPRIFNRSFFVAEDSLYEIDLPNLP